MQVLSYTEIGEKCVHREATESFRRAAEESIKEHRIWNLTACVQIQFYLLLAKWLQTNYFSGPQMSHLKKKGT